MATFKYFSGTQQVQAHWFMRNATFAKCFPDTKGVRYDGYEKLVSVVNNEILPVTRVIEYKSNPSMHKCDARCLHAKGRNCECSCSGANHGAGA